MCFAEWSPDTEQETRVYLYPVYGVCRLTALNETPLPLHTAPPRPGVTPIISELEQMKYKIVSTIPGDYWA